MLAKHKDNWFKHYLIWYIVFAFISMWFVPGCASAPPPVDTWENNTDYNCCHIDVPKPAGPLDYFFAGLADFGKTVAILSIF